MTSDPLAQPGALVMPTATLRGPGVAAQDMVQTAFVDEVRRLQISQQSLLSRVGRGSCDVCTTPVFPAKCVPGELRTLGPHGPLAFGAGLLGRPSGPVLVLHLLRGKPGASRGRVGGTVLVGCLAPDPTCRERCALPSSLPPQGANALLPGKHDLLGFNVCPVLSLCLQTW